MGSIWVQCPATAKKIASTGRLRVGWVSARVEIFPPRPLQCYRCNETGHVKQQCPSSIDRSGRCFTCSEKGHITRNCAVSPNSLLCSDANRQADYRLGNNACCSSTSRQSGRKPTSEEDRNRQSGNTSTASGLINQVNVLHVLYVLYVHKRITSLEEQLEDTHQEMKRNTATKRP